MRKSGSMRLRLADWIAVCVILAFAGGIALWAADRADSNAPPVAEIYLNGVLIQSIRLDTLQAPVELDLDGDFHNHVIAENGSIRVSESDCPGGDCIRLGAAKATGKSIVCLPNRMEIRITGGDGVDAAAR